LFSLHLFAIRSNSGFYQWWLVGRLLQLIQGFMKKFKGFYGTGVEIGVYFIFLRKDGGKESKEYNEKE